MRSGGRYAYLFCLGLEILLSTVCLGQNAAVIQAIRGNKNHLFVPMSINGQKEFWWLVDTGSPLSMITRQAAMAGALKEPEVGSKIPNTVKAEGQELKVVMASSLVSQGFDFGKQPLPILRLDELAREHIPGATASSPGRGILGFMLLAKYGTLINCRTRQLFLSRTGQHLPVTRQAYEQMGFTYVPLDITRGGHIEVVGTIGNETYSFLIDTGAENTLIVAAIRQKEKIPFTDERLSLVGIHDFKKAPISGGTLPNFRVGHYVLNKTFVGFTSLNLQPGEFSHSFGGLIGAEILFDHSAIIDLGNRALYLR
jgi:predicted aspartyl protease